MTGERNTSSRFFWPLAVVLLLVSVCCQIVAFCLFRSLHVPETANRSPEASAKVGTRAFGVTELIELAGWSRRMIPAWMARRGVQTGRVAAEATPEERRLARKYENLKKLETMADFLELTSQEVEIYKLLRQARPDDNSVLAYAVSTIDMHAPNALQEALRCQEGRSETVWNQLDALEEFVSLVDFSCLTEEEYAVFSAYAEAMGEWAENVYADGVEPEVKAELCKNLGTGKMEVRRIASKLFDNAMVSCREAFEEYQAQLQDISVMNAYLDPKRLNMSYAHYTDETGKEHYLLVRLFK